jgi:hypothetical protein
MQSPFQFLAAARLSISERRHSDAWQRFDDAAVHEAWHKLTKSAG